MSAYVAHIERALGVHPSLLALLEDWNRLGSHDVVIAGGEGWPNGGLRTDVLEQHKAFVAGLTKARTLADTPHGRGAALDVWPYGFNPHRGFDGQLDMPALFRVFGQFAEDRGFVWGGRWDFHTPGSTLSGDYPHVEVADWRHLPYPPQPIEPIEEPKGAA